MRIQILEHNSNRMIDLTIPNFLLFSKLGKVIMYKMLTSNSNVDYPMVQFNTLCCYLDQVKNDFKGLKLVEIDTHDNDHICITL